MTALDVADAAATVPLGALVKLAAPGVKVTMHDSVASSDRLTCTEGDTLLVCVDTADIVEDNDTDNVSPDDKDAEPLTVGESARELEDSGDWDGKSEFDTRADGVI